MNISIIIPNFNGEKLLIKNLPRVLEAVRSYADGKIEIIIPDDPSTDNSKEVINKFINNITDDNIVGKTIENRHKELAGFSKNVNRGVDIATGDILILLNSDVYPHIGFLKPLLKHFQDPDVFAVGCLDESNENGKIIHRGRGLGVWNRGLLVHRAGDTDRTNTLWVSGGSGAFRKNIWDKLSGLDAIYDPFYWEDIDISYRALKSGYKVMFESKSCVTHEHEEGSVKKLYTRSYVNKIAYRNQFIFIWKNITSKSLLLSNLFWLPYHILNSIRNNDAAFLKGLSLAILELPTITRRKKIIKKQFKIGDKEIINLFTE